MGQLNICANTPSINNVKFICGNQIWTRFPYVPPLHPCGDVIYGSPHLHADDEHSETKALFVRGNVGRAGHGGVM